MATASVLIVVSATVAAKNTKDSAKALLPEKEKSSVEVRNSGFRCLRPCEAIFPERDLLLTSTIRKSSDFGTP
jgi:hypothetical protein